MTACQHQQQSGQPSRAEQPMSWRQAPPRHPEQQRQQPGSDLLLMNGTLPRLHRCTYDSACSPPGSAPLSDTGSRWKTPTAAITPEEKEGGELGMSQTGPTMAMEGRRRPSEVSDEEAVGEIWASIRNADPHPDIQPPCASASPLSPSSIPPLPPSASASALLALASPATRRSISMGDFKRVTGALAARSEPRSASATAPSSKLVTPSSSMEFQAARRRLLEVEERQRVIHEMERRLEELRGVFVRSEQEVVVHGELVSRISGGAQQGELYVAENSQRLKKGLRFKKHRPTIVFSSMLGLRTCLPWPVKLK